MLVRVISTLPGYLDVSIILISGRVLITDIKTLIMWAIIETSATEVTQRELKLPLQYYHCKNVKVL